VIYLQDGDTQSTILTAQLSADWRIQKLFEFLQISPTYRKAHLLGTAEHEKIGDLPNDFETVESVYADLGEVWNTSLEDWWIRKASRYFAPAIEPQPGLVSKVQELSIRDLSQQDIQHIEQFNRTYEEWGRYWVGDHANQLFPDCALIAVPLRGDASAMKSKLNKLVDQQFRSVEHPPERGRHSFNNSSRVRALTLEKYLFAVRLRSAEPKLKLADIGNAVTDRFGHQKMQSENQKQEQRELESQTSAMFRSALIIAEWAARLHFVSQARLNQVCDDGPLAKKRYKVSFDYEWIGQCIAKGRISAA
jgi:hypothetical protein